MKYLLLYNPVSGKGNFKKKIDYVKKEFMKRNLSLDVYTSKQQFDLKNKAFEEASNYDCFIVSGGDGSVNEVLNGMMQSESRPTLAILPSGTANDTAAMLGINKRVKRTLKLIFDNDPVAMDVNKINNHYFIYTTAAGILTKISYDISRKKIKRYGYLAYVGEGAKDLINDYQMNMDVVYDEGFVKGNYMLVLGLSAKRVGGLYLTKFSDAKLDDGLLEIRLIPYTRWFRMFRLVSFLLLRGRKTKRDIALQSSKYKIKTNDNVIWNVDGEKGAKGSVEITVLKQEVKVIASSKAKKEFFNSHNVSK